MFYPKNVPHIERILRIVLGVILIGAAYFAPMWFNSSSPLLIGVLLLRRRLSSSPDLSAGVRLVR